MGKGHEMTAREVLAHKERSMLGKKQVRIGVVTGLKLLVLALRGEVE